MMATRPHKFVYEEKMREYKAGHLMGEKQCSEAATRPDSRRVLACLLCLTERVLRASVSTDGRVGSVIRVH